MNNISNTKIEDINTSSKFCDIAVRDFIVELPTPQNSQSENVSL